MKTFCLLLLVFTLYSCTPKNNLPTVAFVDAFEDNTIGKAKQGFFDALKKNGFSEQQKTINVMYRNAQGNDITLNQIIQYFKAQQPTLIATCPTTPTIAALQNIKNIPVFMMVAPKPALMKLNNNDGKTPANLFGVGEGLEYIDTAFDLIPKLLVKKSKLKVGLIYSQSQAQSVEALNFIKAKAAALNIELVALPVNTSNETLLVTQSLLSQQIDAFFALPDNVVFASFETILKACNQANVPIFTSESGLVARGAVAAFGAGMYQWGFQAGEQAAQYLKAKSTNGLQWQMVNSRKKVYNAKAAQQFGIIVGKDFEIIN